MRLVINKFSILSPSSKSAFTQDFNSKINLIIGEKDSGKTTLVRAIFYTLGCDVRGFDFTNKMPDNIYLMEFDIDNKKYLLLRKMLKGGRGKNYFKVKQDDKISRFYDTRSFKDFLNEIFNIELRTLDKTNKETSLYPNHIFLPFYTDQDYSWQNYLVSTFSSVQFINNYKKLVLEYFTGSRSNDYYKLMLSKGNIKRELIELTALINSKELIIDENNRNISIVENIDVEEFQKQYKHVLSVYENIIMTEHSLKKKLNEKIYQKNVLVEMKKQLDTSIDEVIEGEVTHHCPNCKQIIYNDMDENYILFKSKENLTNEREKVIMFITDIDDDIKLAQSEVKGLKNENYQYKEKLDADSNTIDLLDRANSFALNQVNSRLLDELEILRAKRDKKEESLERIESSLNDLNNTDNSGVYRQRMIEAFNSLNITFTYKTYYTSNLESVNINMSGASKVQAFIAQYLTLYGMIVETDETLTVPMFIDTFLKDDFNDEEIDRTTKYVFDSLKNNYQSFIFIANNNNTLSAVSEYIYNEIKLNSTERLLFSSYDDVYRLYEDFIEND